MSQYRIGDVTEKLGLSADTLRYYERIGLLNRVSRERLGRNGAARQKRNGRLS